MHRVEDLPRFTERAFWTATSGRPGAVLLNVPMDLFSRPVPAEPATAYPLVAHRRGAGAARGGRAAGSPSCSSAPSGR